eukprot:177040-Hanusia_phi.AAC.3
MEDRSAFVPPPCQHNPTPLVAGKSLLAACSARSPGQVVWNDIDTGNGSKEGRSLGAGNAVEHHVPQSALQTLIAGSGFKLDLSYKDYFGKDKTKFTQRSPLNLYKCDLNTAEQDATAKVQHAGR